MCRSTASTRSVSTSRLRFTNCADRDSRPFPRSVQHSPLLRRAGDPPRCPDRCPGPTLDKVRAAYGYIIIDCPPTLGLLTMNALIAASEVFIPIEPEYYALIGIKQSLSTVVLASNPLAPDSLARSIDLTRNLRPLIGRGGSGNLRKQSTLRLEWLKPNPGQPRRQFSP
ncbi:MAG: AAA family ATPase, partial [Candidatus Riflebacteria bacterium]|nr:AAA family ATPase [Candidatus Riflebacteria bacterium]